MAYVEDKYIEQAIADFDDIERAIIENGVDVPHGTDTKEYGKLINQVGDSYKWFQETFIDGMKDYVITTFKQNPALKRVPAFDFSQVTSFKEIFYLCSNLEEVPKFNTGNVTSFYSSFYGCEKLIEIPQLDCSNATDMQLAFVACVSLKTLPTLNFQNVTNCLRAFAGCVALETITFVPETIKISITIPSAVLSDNSIQSIIDGLAVVETTQTLTLHTDIVNKLTEKQLTQLSNKNWEVEQYDRLQSTVTE